MERKANHSFNGEQSTAVVFIVSANLVLWYDNTNIRVPACYQVDLTSENIVTLLTVYHTLYPAARNIDIGDLHIYKVGS